MPHDVPEVRYATGEVARVGDRVDYDGWAAVVHDVIASAEDMASWGVKEPGLMLQTKEAGLVFEICSSIAWDALVFQSRSA
jgi:hypothetical protein